MKKEILVTGTIAFDHLMLYGKKLLDDLRMATSAEVLSVSFEPHAYVRRHGGTGANIAWNVSLLGGSAKLVANVGADTATEEYIGILQERGIDTTYVDVKQSAETATGFCCSDPKGHQIWFFHRGADTVGSWPEIKEKEGIAYAIIGARYNPQMMEGLEWCKKNNIPSLFDPGQEILRFKREDLERATMLATGVIMNDFEWEMFSKSLNKSAEEIAGETGYLIVTRGEDGYTIFTKDGEQSYPRCNCDNPINPTGAGDAFRAGLVQGLVNGWNLETASKLGAAIASFVVEQDGTLLPSLDRMRIQQRVNEAYGESLPELPL